MSVPRRAGYKIELPATDKLKEELIRRAEAAGVSMGEVAAQLVCGAIGMEESEGIPPRGVTGPKPKIRRRERRL